MIYRCQLCGYEEKVDGSTNDKPVVVRSKVLGVTVRYASSLVKNMADAERRHIAKMHSGAVEDGDNRQVSDL